MENTVIRNIVMFKPSGADFCHSLAYKELLVEHLDNEKILNFEYKGNRITSFDSEEQPCISVETEPLTGTTSLSLRDNKPVAIIQGRASCINFAFLRSLASYSTVPITSGYAQGLKIAFQPCILSKKYPSLHRYTILDEQNGTHLGICFVSPGGQEMSLAFENCTTETQKRIIVGTLAFIIADTFRIKQLTEYAFWGGVLFFFLLFMIVLYFQ